MPGLYNEFIEKDSQLCLVCCKNLDPKGRIDCRAVVNRHDFERMLQSVVGGIFFETVGSYEMENEPFDLFGQPSVVQQSREIKITGELVQALPVAVPFKIRGKQVVVIHVCHYSGVSPERWAEYIHGIPEYRVGIGKMINLPV